MVQKVSIRARPIDRAIPCAASPSDRGFFVSIRARPIDRAIPPFDALQYAPGAFQSAPDQLIGRYPELPAGDIYYFQFQSAPDQLIGRYKGHEGRGGKSGNVSIRARPIDRAILRLIGCYALSYAFQSAPDQLIGRYERVLTAQLRHLLFQSAPDQLIGRYVK